MRIKRILQLILLVSGACLATPLRAASCQNLTDVKVQDAAITLAQEVAAGAFVSPVKTTKPPDPSRYKNLPAFCRVMLTAKPTSDSVIQIEVWMPLSDWNGKLKSVGNGGFAGSISYDSLGSAIRQGYATAATDAGHQGEATDASWALNHPEKIVDFGYRAIHEMTEKAKVMIEAFYGSTPKRSFFDACSDGGREALMEAQRFPSDYDAILAGAPANYWTHLLAAGIPAVKMSQGPGYIPAEKLPAITAAVLAACDAQDGVKDGILNDPRQCRFDPNVLRCKGSDSPTCLSAPQITALKAIYQGPHDSKGEAIFPGLSPGSEDGKGSWEQWVTGPARGKGEIYAYVNGFFSDMIFNDPAWNAGNVKVEEALKLADEKLAKTLNATDANLQPFRDHGGKLIVYHGWNDPAIAPINSINYFESVKAKMGPQQTDSFIRLYMAPGMQHCLGGPGPSFFGQLGLPGPHDVQHDMFKALEQWSESGVAPDAIIATKFVDNDSKQAVQMTRPLCPYPLIAKYKGQGDPNQASNFSCGPNQ